MSWEPFWMKVLEKKRFVGSVNSARDLLEKHHNHKTCLKKKKKKRKHRHVIIGIQTDTQSSMSWVLDSYSPPNYNFEPWTSPSYISFFFFFFLIYLWETNTHTQGRDKWILIQKHTTKSTPTLLPNSILNLKPYLHIIIFFYRSKHTQGRERNSNTKAHYKLHWKVMKNLLSLEFSLKVFVYVYVSYNSKIYF